MIERMKHVGFADEETKQAFFALSKGKFEEKQLLHNLEKAVDELKENPFVGIKIPQKLWPKQYIKKYCINNLRKYDLPDGWRLIYTIKGNEIEIISVILEWFKHKDYEKKFGYKVK